MSAAETNEAARLVAFGLRPKKVPAEEPAYLDLVRRYRQQDHFASTVKALADGMGLDVLDVTEAAGIVLGARTDTPFAVRMEEYNKSARETSDRVLHGLAHLAIAATCFPRPADLEDLERVPRVAVNEVDEYLRDLCRRLDEQHQGQALDPPAEEPEMARAWRVYADRPEASRTRDERAWPKATRQILSRAFAALVDHGLMRKVSDDLGGTYRARAAYRVHVAELAQEDVWFELDRITNDTDVPRW